MDLLEPRHEVEIVEVGPRDGFQPIGPLVATERKLRFIREAFATGLRRIEIGSLVSASAVPQMADTPDLMCALADDAGLLSQILVPTARRGEAAAAAGAPMLAFVLSVSPAHNHNNVRRSPDESAAEYEALASVLDSALPVRLNLATAFDCPFDGRVAPDAVFRLLDRLVPARPDAEICLCDTTGRAVPRQVAALFAEARARFPAVRRWALHGHDTYGLGCANAFAAHGEGVRVFDAAFGGLGGCPFAPGATGNVATEDLVWLFEEMGVSTGVALPPLLALARDAAALPGAQPGGRVRAALEARRRV